MRLAFSLAPGKRARKAGRGDLDNWDLVWVFSGVGVNFDGRVRTGGISGFDSRVTTVQNSRGTLCSWTLFITVLWLCLLT